MPLFEIRNDTLSALTATTVSKECLKEREHVQRMLRDQVMRDRRRPPGGRRGDHR